MEKMLTIFDWAVIGVVGLSALLALFRGFVREVLSLIAWLVAAYVTITYYAPVAEMLKPHIASNSMRMGAATVGLFLLVLIVLAIINTVIMRFLNAGGNIGILDSVLGMLFGVARGMFVVAMAYLMLSVVFEKDNLPDWLKKSRTRPAVEYSANILAQLAPNKVKMLQKSATDAKEQGELMQEQDKFVKAFEVYKHTGKLPEWLDESKRAGFEQMYREWERQNEIKANESNLDLLKH